MATEREILKYEIDLTDVEAKAKRLLDLKQQIDSGRASGHDTSALEDELRRAMGGFDGVARSGKRANDELFDFDRKGEKLVKGLLGTLNPQLAAGADMMIDLAEGTSKLSGALLAVAGAGAGIGVLLAIVTELQAQMQRLNQFTDRQLDALKKFRDETATVQVEAADKARGAGLAGVAGSITEYVTEAENAGVPRGLAMNIGIARELAAARGLEFDERQYMQGVLVSDKPPEFGSNQAANDASIRSMMRTGARPDAAAAAEAYLRDVNAQTRKGALSKLGLDEPGNSLDASTEQVSDNFPGLTEVEKQYVRQLAEFEDPTSNRAMRGVFKTRFQTRWYKPDHVVWDASTQYDAHLGRRDVPYSILGNDVFGDANLGSFKPDESYQTVRELVDLAIKAREGTPDPELSTSRGPVIYRVNVTNNSFGTAHFGGGNALRNPNFDSPVHSPGGGLHRNGVE